MKFVALIPARYAATRFPAKLMQLLGGKSIIRRTYENTRDTRLFDEVIVVTDSQIMFEEITSSGGYAVMSQGVFESGSDRIAAAAAQIDSDVIVNVQGDEPFVNKRALAGLLEAFTDPTVQVASLMCPLDKADIDNPNAVKVVCDNFNDALYFSRSPIPYFRNTQSTCQPMKHIGIYAYKKEILMQFPSWEKSPLENAEMLEQLRLLAHGIKIKMVETAESPVAIDTPQDLLHAEALLKNLIRNNK